MKIRDEGLTNRLDFRSKIGSGAGGKRADRIGTMLCLNEHTMRASDLEKGR